MVSQLEILFNSPLLLVAKSLGHLDASDFDVQETLLFGLAVQQTFTCDTQFAAHRRRAF